MPKFSESFQWKISPYNKLTRTHCVGIGLFCDEFKGIWCMPIPVVSLLFIPAVAANLRNPNLFFYMNRGCLWLTW